MLLHCATTITQMSRGNTLVIASWPGASRQNLTQFCFIALYCKISWKSQDGAVWRAAGFASHGEWGRVEREPESKQPSISECGVRAGRGDPWRPWRLRRVQAISVKCNQDVDMRPSGNNHITFHCNDLQSVPRSHPVCTEFAARKLWLLIRNISRLRIGKMYDRQCSIAWNKG